MSEAVPGVGAGAPAAAAAAAANGGEEDCSKEYAPVVQLAQVETKTGEEDEEVVFKMRAKLFRFSKELKEWKERGTGDVRFLQHRASRKIRLLMRREKTLKICLNHFVNPSVALRENVGSDRSWVWNAVDYADAEPSDDLLAIRFRDSKNAALFKDEYDRARDVMKAILRPPAEDAADDHSPDSSPKADQSTPDHHQPSDPDQKPSDPDQQPADETPADASDTKAE